MKKLIFGLTATILLSFNAHSQKVGIINKDGKFEITEDLSFLKEKWNAILKENGIEGELERFEITKEHYVDDCEEVKDFYYQITGYSNDLNLKGASTLQLEGDSFSVEFSSSCTCASDCMYGCHPRRYRKIGWACEPGCSGGGCRKTETAN